MLEIPVQVKQQDLGCGQPSQITSPDPALSTLL